MANEQFNQSQSQGKQKKPGNFSNEETLEGTTEDGVEVSASLDDGNLSAESSDDDVEQGDTRERPSGSGSFANDRAKASEAGR
jgi:hypothetical protein